MKGMLIKDWKLMKGQKNFFILIFIVALGMTIFGDDTSFALGFLSFVVSLFTISTISYDEFDNGNAFLFTLPITRTNYAIEKYVLGLLLGAGGWLLALMVVILSNLFKETMPVLDIIRIATMIFPVMLVILAFMIPFQLKFGSEKGRIAIIGAVGLTLLLGIGVVKVAELLSIDLISMFNNVAEMNFGMLLVVVLGIALIICAISMTISISIMKKKEF